MRLVGDIGGTTMRLAFAEREDESVELRNVVRHPTPPSPAEALQFISSYIAAQPETPSEMVVGIAGTLESGVLIESPNLPGWIGAHQGDWAQAFSLPVRLYNDADVAGVAEARTGAGKGKSLVGYITVGTGVGGALLKDGALVPSARTLEPGKQVIDFETGRTLESFVGGAALENELGMPPAELAHTILDERAGILAIGLYDLVRTWSPEILVLNGSLMDEKDGYRLEVVSAELLRIAGTLPLPPLALAVFRDESGLVGASFM